ncbi:TetR/AcrR family transcriptional regulator [Nocardia sp. NBC_01503]|uniref:TetR/AcrR family transcriptional regulator n=1 Tax=Nocardia sp. NBC_01503 TaxID=2975997 RepID=UPI002E7BFFDF|nr:TetR/AcrR family transcriptional regulator [Nocardia sp. NBC_01503]WTL34102.1 TetR/AcrR family transcriptional regulator [Nocardia sp. NBC_01503]
MPTKDRYHHGDLREELLRASVRLIETEGLTAVSLRRVAREAGVSPGAPYHHFTDRAALLAAISARGFEQLGARMISVREGASGPREALIAMTVAYVEFARDSPAYFRLMFRPELYEPDKHPATATAGDAAYAVLEQAVADATGSGGLPSEEADTLALALWSLAHGLASLTLDGKLELRSAQMGTTAVELSDRVTRLFTDLIDSRWPRSE